MEIVHLKLHQFSHQLLDSLRIILERGAQSVPPSHDGVHLSTIPAKERIVGN